MKLRPIPLATLLASLTLSATAQATSFVISDGQTETTTQTLDGDNETGVVESGGTLSTDPTAVNVTGAAVTVTNSGNISTTGAYAHGIHSTGINSSITSSGIINTAGGYAYGIYSTETADITNSGSISTTADDANGIGSVGTDASITSSGSISTAGDDAHAIVSSGGSASISNSGRISTAGDRAWGIWSLGANASITNIGSISTVQSHADGIRSTNGAATITNSGSISTKGFLADGIYSNKANASITNSGSISTTGVHAYGINSGDVSASNASITNSGSISTGGDYARGISSVATDASITNSGSISTTGLSAYGINSQGFNASITHSGSISTTGNSAHGIWSTGTNAIITHSGSISTSGNTAHGIWSTGTNAIITHSGSIAVTGANSYAILGTGGTQTLNILSGSRILGRIDLGADADVANIYGSSGSAVLTIENTETINVLMDNAVLVNGDTVVVVDPTGESNSANALNAMTSGAHQVVSQRMQRTPAPKPVQLASLALTPGMLSQERSPVLWGQLFGYSGERGAQGAMQASEHDYQGLVVGYERDLARNRIGLLVGAASSDSKSSSQARDTDSVFLGAYGHRSLGKAQLTASLLLGWEEHDSQRQVVDNLNGIETARSRTDSLFISPSLTLGSTYTIRPDLELRPSATLGYSVGRYDGYTETGTTQANLTVGSRSVDVTSSRLQLEGAKRFPIGEINLRAGVQSRHSNADDIKASLAGSNFQYSAASDDKVSGSFIGAGVSLSLANKLELVADVEAGEMSGDEEYLSGQVTLQYRF